MGWGFIMLSYSQTFWSPAVRIGFVNTDKSSGHIWTPITSSNYRYCKFNHPEQLKFCEHDIRLLPRDYVAFKSAETKSRFVFSSIWATASHACVHAVNATCFIFSCCQNELSISEQDLKGQSNTFLSSTLQSFSDTNAADAALRTKRNDRCSRCRSGRTANGTSHCTTSPANNRLDCCTLLTTLPQCIFEYFANHMLSIYDWFGVFHASICTCRVPGSWTLPDHLKSVELRYHCLLLLHSWEGKFETLKVFFLESGFIPVVSVLSD